MSIFDTGNWKLYTPDPNEARKPSRGSIKLIISSKVVTLSAEARKAMDNPTNVDIWLGKEDGRVLFIRRKSEGIQVRNTKDGRIHIRNPEFISDMMERLILYGSVEAHIGQDDKPLPGAYFCTEGKNFKERDPKDSRHWLIGVEFNLASAYYCQVDMNGVAKGQEVLKRKRERKQG